MIGAPKLEECLVRYGDQLPCIELTVRNPGPDVFGPGGLRFIVEYRDGTRVKASAPCWWHIDAGEAIKLIGVLPLQMTIRRLRTVSDFAYVECSGKLHPIAGMVEISMLGNNMMTHES